jgi:hypothetical protein
MTIAFSVAAAVALLAILTLVVTTRRAAAQLEAARSQVQQLEDQLRSADSARPEAEPPAQADPPALAAALERADRSDRRAAAAEGRLSAAGMLWELERLRLEREWADVAGATVPLPEPWDGGIRPAIAVELEIIREVIGVPSRLEPDRAASPADPVTTMSTARLTAEALRDLARVSEEIVVSLAPDGAVTMTIASEDAGTEPHLAHLSAAAAAMGGELAVIPTGEGLQARLCLPAPTG